jgi:RNA polymerase sigma factor (sigma-70 family)
MFVYTGSGQKESVYRKPMKAKDEMGGTTGPYGEAFGRLYEQFLPGVFQYVSYRVGDKNAAEDVTSDIFSKALTKFDRFDPRKAAFSTWIFSIARNTVIDYYRSRGRTLNFGEETDPITAASTDSTEEELSREEERQKLRQCISQLKPNEQELISLKFSSELNNREIARLTGLSESNVGVILCRAVRKLRDRFGEWQ